MIIEFLQDYCGRETAMVWYRKGEQGTLSFAQAKELIKFGIAKEIEAQEIAPEFVAPKKKSKRLEALAGNGGGSGTNA